MQDGLEVMKNGMKKFSLEQPISGMSVKKADTSLGGCEKSSKS